MSDVGPFSLRSSANGSSETGPTSRSTRSSIAWRTHAPLETRSRSAALRRRVSIASGICICIRFDAIGLLPNRSFRPVPRFAHGPQALLVSLEGAQPVQLYVCIYIKPNTSRLDEVPGIPISALRRISRRPRRVGG